MAIEKSKKDFIKYVTELSQAYALCATTAEARQLNVEIGFFKAKLPKYSFQFSHASGLTHER